MKTRLWPAPPPPPPKKKKKKKKKTGLKYTGYWHQGEWSPESKKDLLLLSFFIDYLQGSNGHWKMKVVMEKSWNMKNWPKAMEVCDQSWNLTNLAPESYQICTFFATFEKLSIDVGSVHFSTFSAKCHKYEMKMRDCHKKIGK